MARSSGLMARELPMFLTACKITSGEKWDTESSSGRTLLTELPPDNPGGRATGMGDSEGELFSKSCFYFYIAGEGGIWRKR